jgi:hypothetical protein
VSLFPVTIPLCRAVPGWSSLRLAERQNGQPLGSDFLQDKGVHRRILGSWLANNTSRPYAYQRFNAQASCNLSAA